MTDPICAGRSHGGRCIPPRLERPDGVRSGQPGGGGYRAAAARCRQQLGRTDAERIAVRYGKRPSFYLADAGFCDLADIDVAHVGGTLVSRPATRPRTGRRRLMGPRKARTGWRGSTTCRRRTGHAVCGPLAHRMRVRALTGTGTGAGARAQRQQGALRGAAACAGSQYGLCIPATASREPGPA